MVTKSLEHVALSEESSQPQSSYEAVATLIEFELKKILIDQIDKSESYLVAPEHGECYEGLIKSYDLDKSLFSTYGKVYTLKRSQKDKDKDEDPSTGSDRGLKKRKTSKDAEPATCPKGKESQSGSSKGTQVEVIRKQGYGYLKEIVVRRADNDLYRFNEGDFPRLRINDIEDMLLLAVQNRLTKISGDDVFDFAIALRMFTRSLVIQKRVEDLQLGVESYQKKINVTKPQTTIPGIRKRDPYTP
ncbi:hypothetical protein Tco_0736404 [Tanacetum coccineum]